MDLLESTIQTYAWGSRTAIPELLGREPDGRPQAEIWFGAHPSAPSIAERDGVRVGLDQIIAADPEREVGRQVVGQYGARLPFLLKILAAAEPLSVQAHPDLERATAGYAAEEDRQLAADDPTRSYKDPNHKPEMLLALTRFEALCGFRPVEETVELLDRLDVPALTDAVATLRKRPDADGLREVVEWVLRRTPVELERLVADVAKAATALRVDAYERELATVLDLAARYPADTGVVCALLLNRVTLEPGEAVYLPAGNLHAYLEGVGVEAMACSDNVLRGGLTSKHVDVDELLRVLTFQPGRPHLVRPQVDGPEAVYAVPVPDFCLSRVDLDDGGSYVLASERPQIVVSVAGPVALRRGDRQLSASAGHAVFVPVGAEPVELRGPAHVVRITTKL